MFEVILSPEAREFFEAAEVALARKLARCFAQLELEPLGTITSKDSRAVGPECLVTESVIGG
jgi:hypothetical protein